MKKIMFALIALVVCMFFVSVSFAGDKGGKGDRKGMGCPMCRMNCDMMMEGKKLIATQDGGVVLMMGNKLIKYDAQLNIVKEAEVKIDIEAMCKTMEDMRMNCPMCKGMECDMKGKKR